MFSNEIKEYTVPRVIEAILKLRMSGIYCFSNKEDAETNKWIHDLLEKELDDRLSAALTWNFLKIL